MVESAAAHVRVVSPGQTYVGKQGFIYGSGASAETVGARQICMNILPMPGGARAKMHSHRAIETIAYLLEGTCDVYYGAALERHMSMRAGEQIFVPADVPHAPFNRGIAPCTWIVVHASGSDQDGLVLLPELEQILETK